MNSKPITSAKEFWKSKFDEYPQNDAEKLAVTMMAEFHEQFKAQEQKPVWVEKLCEIRNNIYDSLPTGEINAFDLTTVIMKHIVELDKFIDEQSIQKPIPITDDYTHERNCI